MSHSTTGEPKGVEWSHLGLLSAIVHYKQSTRRQQSWASDLGVATLRGILFLLTAIKSRSRFTIYDFPEFDVSKLVDTIVANKSNVILASIQAVDGLVARNKCLNLPHIQSFMVGGDMISHATRTAVQSILGKRVLRIIYRISEVSNTIAADIVDASITSSACVGRLAPGFTARIVDDGNCVVEDGHIGNLQILSRPCALMKGYWQNGDALRDLFTSDSWLKTGDVGRFDEEGRLHVHGRKNEFIQVDDWLVHLTAIREMITRLPMVAVAYVVTVRENSPDGRELPRAYIVIKAGSIGCKKVEINVHKHVTERMGEHYRLTGGVKVVGMEYLPYLSNGTADMKKLRRRAQREWESEEKANTRPVQRNSSTIANSTLRMTQSDRGQLIPSVSTTTALSSQNTMVPVIDLDGSPTPDLPIELTNSPIDISNAAENIRIATGNVNGTSSPVPDIDHNNGDKPRRRTLPFTAAQLAVLEEEFALLEKPDIQRRRIIAQRTGVDVGRVNVSTFSSFE